LRHRRGDARAYVADLTRSLGPADLVVDVLAPVQVEVGVLWETRAITTEQGHWVTAAVDAMIAGLGPPPSPEAGSVVSACVPGEWHALPARMANSVVELGGWRVRFTGANTSPDRLRRQLRAHRPLAVALSCAMPCRLTGARDLVDVAHDEGLPVVVGGRGFDERRARRLGADAFVRDPRDAEKVLREWSLSTPELAVRARPPGDEFATLVVDRESLVRAVMDRVVFALGDGVDGTIESRLELGVRLLHDHLAAALYLEEDTLFLDAVASAAVLGEERGFPKWTAASGLGALEAALGPEMTCTRGLVEAAVARLEP
jgi:methanogenic corrinoid protein MtbC1